MYATVAATDRADAIRERNDSDKAMIQAQQMQESAKSIMLDAQERVREAARLHEATKLALEKK
jgi:hypothetical protein